jgi:hypothetical protein
MSNLGIPAHFVQLPQETVEKALAGHEDLLSGEALKAEAIYRQHKACRNGCGNTMEKSAGGPRFAFGDPDWSIPRCLMKCYACGFTLNPFDGMVVAAGDSNKAKYGDTPLIER